MKRHSRRCSLGPVSVFSWQAEQGLVFIFFFWRWGVSSGATKKKGLQPRQKKLTKRGKKTPKKYKNKGLTCKIADISSSAWDGSRFEPETSSVCFEWRLMDKRQDPPFSLDPSSVSFPTEGGRHDGQCTSTTFQFHFGNQKTTPFPISKENQTFTKR